MFNHSFLMIVAAGGVLGAAASAHAAMIDLTSPGASGSINGARFLQMSEQPAGTGVFEPFVRIRMHGFEEGYNTSASPKPFDELSGAWTRNIQVKDLLTTTVDGVTFYDFRLDINESNGGNNNLLSLDRIKIYTSPIASQNTTNLAALGTLRYDLDAGGDNWVKLDYDLASGSGESDMLMLLPASTLAAAAPDDYVYFYSAFGTNFSSSAGFEEWAIRGQPIPAPGPLVVAGLGLLLIAKRRR